MNTYLPKYKPLRINAAKSPVCEKNIATELRLVSKHKLVTKD